MNTHELEKIESGWTCKLCTQKWKGKPRAMCPGMQVYEAIPSHLTTTQQLASLNRKPTREPVGCFKKSSEYVFLYDPEHIEVDNPDLPPIYNWDNRPKDLKTPNQLYRYNRKAGDTPYGCIWHDKDWVFLYRWEECPISDESMPPYIEYGAAPELKTEKQLKDNNLVPGDAKPRGFFRLWDSKEKYWITFFLYHPDDCEWNPPDNYITKSTLKDRYLLSDSWIKRIGNPDLICDNPHHHRWSSMRLYSRQRVEQFLADNAKEYSEWLDERDKYIAIFEEKKEVIAQCRERHLEIKRQRKEQQIQCFQCASGCALGRGFICAIYPKGLEDYQIPCVDFVDRKKLN